VTNLLDMCRDLPLVTVPAGEVLVEQGAARPGCSSSPPAR
jgi:hypothetical protein